MYNPALGRFMQTDPIGYEDDLDLYAYVGNDPLDGTDPSGECFLVIFGSDCGIYALPQAPPPAGVTAPPTPTARAAATAAETATAEEVVVTAAGQLSPTVL